jgi:uracil phosphoribosyltransferase
MALVFPSTHPLVRHKLTLLRDTHTEPKKFRELVRELALLMTYEATADLALVDIAVTTPMGQARGFELAEKVGLVPVLRAGLGMVEGIWEMMPSAEVWHIGLYRDEKTLRPVQYYNKLPVSPTVEVCLILDPMLATGGSSVATVDILKQWGAKRIKYVGSSLRRRASSACRLIPTFRFTSRRLTSGSTTSVTSCRVWATQATDRQASDR